MSDLTPYQTVGPFFQVLLDLPAAGPADSAGADVVTITGVVLDGAGQPVPDALLEAWHPALSRIARAPAAEGGRFELALPAPGATPGQGGATQAPHVVVGVLARGILTRLVTRVYFEDEPGNDADPVLTAVPEARRRTLVARREGPGRYRFDLVLQGPGETVFFDV